MTLTALAALAYRITESLKDMPHSCPYARLAAKRVEGARSNISAGRYHAALERLEDAQRNLEYAASAARIRTLRSEASAEAARSFHA